MNLFGTIMIAIYLTQLIAAAFVIFFEKKDPSVTLVWVLIIVFLPVVGYLFYFLFGTTIKLKMEAKYKRIDGIEKKYLEFIEKQFSLRKKHSLNTNEAKLQNYTDLITLNTQNTISCYTENNSVKIFKSGREKFDMLFKEIKEAKVSINIVYFILNPNDKIGKEFIKILEEKARKGVKVRLVYDRFGNVNNRYRYFSSLVEAGGEVVPYMPSVFKTFVQMNYRMHRKMVIIDGKIAYTGGINVGDEYINLHKKLKPWRDTSIRLTGPSVNAMQLRFITDFIFLKTHFRKPKNMDFYNIDVAKELFPEPILEGNAGVQIVSSGPDSDQEYIKDGYIKMINLAKKYIYIETPYFIPDQAFLNAIRIAALSGVDVRVVIPKLPDKKFVYYITLSYIQDLLKWGVKVYLYEGFIHAKSIVIDDIVSSIGSTNVDIRSFRLNYELNAFIYDEEVALLNKDIFKNDLKRSKAVKYSEYKKRFIGTKFMECICRFIAPLA